MQDRQIKVAYLMRKFKYKFDSGQLSAETWEMYQKNIWYSLPIVYPNFEEDFHCISKEIEKRKKVKRRVNHYIKDMCECYVDSQIYFVTLTFDDVYLSHKDSSRRKYVLNFLNDVCRDYLANIDHGSKNQREHYHAVCVFLREFDMIDMVKSKWLCGFSSIKPCGVSRDDDDHTYRISSYILKLANHAGKLTAGKVFHKKLREDIDELPF